MHSLVSIVSCDELFGIGAEVAYRHKIHDDRSIPHPNALPLACASIYPSPSRPLPALSRRASPATPVTPSQIVSPSSASMSPMMPLISLYPTSSMIAVASSCGSQSSCGNSEDYIDDDDSQLWYPDSEDGYESMDVDIPAMSPVYYPVPTLLSRPHLPQLWINTQHTTSDRL